MEETFRYNLELKYAYRVWMPLLGWLLLSGSGPVEEPKTEPEPEFNMLVLTNIKYKLTVA